MKKFFSSLKSLIKGDPLGVLNAAGGLFNAFASIGAGKREEKRKKRLMDYEDKIADENYEKQLSDQRQLIAEDRQYNSIGSQIQRARGANISPLAALGVSSGNSIGAQSPSQSAPTPPAGGVDSLTTFASSLQGAMMNMAQMQMLNKQMEKIDQETANVELQNVKQRFENIMTEIEANGYSEKYAITLDTLKQELKQKGLAAKISENELQFMLDSYDERLRGVTLSNDLTQAEKGLKEEQTTDLSKTRDSRIAQNTASAREANAIARSEDAFRDLRKSILSNENETKRSEKVSAFCNSIADAWSAYYLQRYGENPPQNQYQSVISLIKRTIFGSDKQTSNLLSLANSDRGMLGFLLNVVTLDSGDTPPSFREWYESLTR